MSKVLEMLAEVQKASRMLGIAEVETINALLLDLADAAVKNTSFILHENQKDLERMDKNDPKYDRLQLTQSRIEDIAKDIRNVASLPSPLNKIMEQRTLPNGLELSKIKVPIGVIGIIYEARPNVTFDVFSLCVKSGNACVLKGGSDAEFSNIAIIKVIKEVIKKHGLDENIVCLLPSDRAATTEMLNAVAYVDMIIPRGSQNLINYVRDNAKVPVIETGAGIVHIYFDESGDKEKGKKIIYNAKTRRVSVCNALDCLVIHRKRLNDLYFLVEDMTQKNVVIYADDESYASLQGKYPSNLLEKATEEHFGIEFLSARRQDYPADGRKRNRKEHSPEPAGRYITS